MGALRQREIFHTIEEYLAFENHVETRHEYLQGEIYAMAGATPRHNDIAGNIFSALKNQLRGRGCIPRISDQRLYVAQADLLTYPDVLVVCPPQRYSELDSIALSDVTLLAEVLSLQPPVTTKAPNSKAINICLPFVITSSSIKTAWK